MWAMKPSISLIDCRLLNRLTVAFPTLYHLAKAIFGHLSWYSLTQMRLKHAGSTNHINSRKRLLHCLFYKQKVLSRLLVKKINDTLTL